MIDKVLKNIEEYNLLQSGDKIAVGFSGGADSASLIYILNSIKDIYNLEIIAVHLNHMLRGEEANRDEAFVKKACDEYRIELFSFQEDCRAYAKKNKITEEEAGRFLRYRAFNEIAKKEGAQKIAVAHNKNDQVETMIMRFMRGTGINGLAGMDFINNNLIRPLLNISRSEIEHFCYENKISYINDSSNTTNLYTRNKIRHELLPYVENNFNSGIIDKLFELSALYKSENEYIEKKVHEFIQKHVIIKESIDIRLEEFKAQHETIKRRVVRKSIETIWSIKDYSFEHIEAVLRLIYVQNGKSINLPNNIIAAKNYGFITLRKNIKYDGFCYDLNLDEPVFIKEKEYYVTVSLNKLEKVNKLCNVCTKIFSYDKIKNVIQIRTRQKGDVICINNHHKKIKDFFIDKKISKFDRDNIPLLTDGSNVICIPYIKDSDYYNKIDKENILYLQIWKGLD